MSRKRSNELTGADLAFDLQESDITLADMDVEGILTESQRTPGRRLNEKWAGSPKIHQTGEFEGQSKADLQKRYNALKKSGPHSKGSSEYTEMKKLGFAIRSKQKGPKFGKVSDAADSMNEAGDEGYGINVTKELLAKLLSAVVDQSPDEEKIEDIAMGMASACQKQGGTLDVGDIGMIMGEIKTAHEGHDEDSQEDMAMDQAMGSEEEEEPGAEGEMEEDVACEGCGSFEENSLDDESDMKKPRGGGERHEKKEYQLMDDGADYIDDPREKAEFRKQMKGGKSFAQSSKAAKRADEESTPISQVTTKGKGPGGGSADDYGQSPSDEIIPEYPSGNDDAVPGKPLDNVTPPPGSGKSGKPVSEAWLAGVPGTFRDTGDNPEIDPDDPNAELKMIKRRAGLPDWWKS